METARDLACPALWQQSLERSLARRGRPTRSSLELFQLRPERDLAHPELLRESLKYSQLRRTAPTRRPAMAVPSAGGISALAILAAATLPGLVSSRSGGEHAGAERVAFKGGVGGKRLEKAPAADLALDPALAAKAASVAAVAPAPVDAVRIPTPAHPAPARQVTHQARTSFTSPSSRHLVRSSPPARAPRHVALARDASGGVAHALSGGAAPRAPRTSAAAPRVPAEPQPSGHPSTGGGAIEAASHPTVKTPAKPHPAASAHPVATTPAASTTPAPPPAPSGNYTNPLAGASVTAERVDQGVDYSGSGTLKAIGGGKVVYVGTSGTGWPGAFIEYRLSAGAYAGRYVYYAESISPAAGLHVGQTVQAGQPIASIHGGIEIGWGSGVGTQPLAQADGHWSAGADAENHPTPDGKSFSALVAQLGGPPGKIEG